MPAQTTLSSKDMEGVVLIESEALRDDQMLGFHGPSSDGSIDWTGHSSQGHPRAPMSVAGLLNT